MQNRRNTVYVLLILSLLAGLFTGRSFFFNLAYMFVGLMLISFIWAWLAVRWITIGRKTRARRAQVGRQLEEIFIVRNRAIIPKLWLEVRDHSNLPGHRASNIVPALGSHASYRWRVQTNCIARGEFQLGPVTLVSGDPFGLFVSPRKLNLTSRVVIYPETIPIRYFDLPIGILSGGEARRRRTHYVTTNAAGVREYVNGDSFNRIHWPTTARRNKLMVKEFEIDPLVDIWIFVDFSANSLVESPNLKRINKTGPALPNGERIPPSTEEYSVVIAASLAQYFTELDRSLGFAAYTPHREIIQPDRGDRQLNRILQTLAVARSFSIYTLQQMLILETPYFTRGTTLIIVTSSLDTSWVTEAQTLTSRGIRPMCIFVDPYSFDGQYRSDEMQSILQLAHIPMIVVRRNDDLASVLSQKHI
ncbi:MAG: DUF58 domain-containing protein [Chloroflexi bacterium]|nr:MAG: DUF58 domain-containing protein [Chloroflexota bacterium]